MSNDEQNIPTSEPTATAIATEENLKSAVTKNGINGTTANGHAAIQRGLELLAETDLDNNLDEIKKLDSQIDHFNSYLDKFEARNEALNKKLNTLLESQKEERLKRRASFQQKEIENRAESEAMEAQMRALLNRCHQARRISVPEFPVSYQEQAPNTVEAIAEVDNDEHHLQNGDVIAKNESSS